VKITTIPTSKVTENAVMAPKTEFRVPLAPRINVPNAIIPLDQTSRRASPPAEARARACHALHTAPPKITIAPPAEPMAARTRGSDPKTFDPWTSSFVGNGARKGAVTTTPAAKAANNPTPTAAASPQR
jgi:hypothetical protein